MVARLEPRFRHVEHDRLVQLRRRLLSSARGRAANVPAADVEDVVQDALVRFLRESPRAGAPADEVRAHVALRRERADYYRRRARRREEATVEPVPLLAAGASPDALLVQAAVAIEQIAGDDARIVAELRGEHHSYDDIARELAWPLRRVEAARKQLERYRPQIAAALAIHLGDAADGT